MTLTAPYNYRISMNIQEEFARLTTLASTPAGWSEIEAPFYNSANEVGFAMVLNSWQYEVGHHGDSHIQAKKDLLHRILQEMSASEYEKYERRLIQGRMARHHSFSFPLLLFLCLDERSLGLIEPRIIEMRIALPVGGLFLKNNPGLVQHITATTAL
jgi:hypothetical protein